MIIIHKRMEIRNFHSVFGIIEIIRLLIELIENEQLHRWIWKDKIERKIICVRIVLNILVSICSHFPYSRRRNFIISLLNKEMLYFISSRLIFPRGIFFIPNFMKYKGIKLPCFLI